MSNLHSHDGDIYQENLSVIAYLLEKATKHLAEGKTDRMLSNVKSIQVIAQAMIEEGELNA